MWVSQEAERLGHMASTLMPYEALTHAMVNVVLCIADQHTRALAMAPTDIFHLHASRC